jgi:phenylpropionate dioxygenase-like ring-hydroxylating dioxygenase large terminal subunit
MAARFASPAADPLDDLSLPGWVYRDPDYFQVEMARVIRPLWQIVCHESDIAAAGDWRTLELLGESILVIRGQDARVRAFTNVCRHRGSRLVDGEAGCAKRLTCPYHAWTYAADGRLIGVPDREDYPGLDASQLGLIPVEMENWRGFLFVRLEGGGPSVAAMMAPFETEVAPHRFEELRAIGRITLRPRAVNWKTIADNYSDGLHINVAHPGLTRLFGQGYGIEAGEHVDRMWGDLVDRPSSDPSERAYQHFLPKEAGRRWLYFKLWPNVALDIYPDQVDFMHFVPVGPCQTMIREISYAVPDGRREMKAARYLNWRINRRVNAEDTVLIARVQQGVRSAFYRPGPLGESEVCLRSFARKLRRIIPETRLESPPPGWRGS